MVQNVSWEWLLEGFKYELEATVKPKSVDYYYSHARVFTGWAQHRGQLANPYLTTKRHINLAIALMGHPELLFLDEPTVGIDPQSRNNIYENIEGLRDKGMTILYTTHYMEEADRLCDRVAIMDGGQIIAMDTRYQLKGQIGSPEQVTLEDVFLKLTGRSLRD